MDRNLSGSIKFCNVNVALRKESVDRNDVLAISAVLELVSLSVRRAWIEITYVIRLPRVQVSLSVRRAWIEILVAITPSNFSNVALRKESVDRNSIRPFATDSFFSRSP